MEPIYTIYSGVVGGILSGLILVASNRISKKIYGEKYWWCELLVILTFFVGFSYFIHLIYV